MKANLFLALTMLGAAGQCAMAADTDSPENRETTSAPLPKTSASSAYASKPAGAGTDAISAEKQAILEDAELDYGDPEVLRGKELFDEIGCAYCHRPSWKTDADEIRDPARFFKGNELPRFPYQTIWPYTDMVQHKLLMANDIRGGWCRTTPLWGRGLHQKVTGSATADRLHDCRARTTMEAIMWHGYSPQSDGRRSVELFRKLPKADRDAIIRFVDAI